MRYAVASVLLAVMFVGSTLLNLYVSSRVTQAAQHQWCSVLVLLTARPVTPPANTRDKTRESQYVFYLQLRALEGHFHC